MERSRLAHGPRVLSLAQSSHLKSEQSAGWIGVSRLAEDRRKDTAVLACDVGGTRLRVARVYPDGSVCGKKAISTPQGDPTALARVLAEAIDGPGGRPEAVVVGIPGPVDYSTGAPLRLPNLLDWEGHIHSSLLQDELGIPVVLANDADLATLGEYTYGAGRFSTDMVYVTVSTGVGAGVVLGGKLVRGRLSLAEIGHTIIDRRSGETLETLGSGTALGRLSGDDGASVAARAVQGDPEAAICRGTHVRSLVRNLSKGREAEVPHRACISKYTASVQQSARSAA